MDIESKTRRTPPKKAPPSNEPSQLLTVDQAAALLQVSRATMYRIMKQHNLHLYQITPDMKRLRRSELEAFLTSRLTTMSELESAEAKTTEVENGSGIDIT